MKTLCELQSGQTSLVVLDGLPHIVVMTMTPRGVTRPAFRTSVYQLHSLRLQSSHTIHLIIMLLTLRIIHSPITGFRSFLRGLSL
jgi:hypothetical protein